MLDSFAKGQTHHIRVRTHDSFHKGPSPLNGVPAGFVKRLPGGDLQSDLRGSRGLKSAAWLCAPLRFQRSMEITVMTRCPRPLKRRSILPASFGSFGFPRTRSSITTTIFKPKSMFGDLLRNFRAFFPGQRSACLSRFFVRGETLSPRLGITFRGTPARSQEFLPPRRGGNAR